MRYKHLQTQEQFDRAFKEEDGLITRLRAAGHNPLEGAYRRKAYILFDALMAKEKNGAPINIDREQALIQIRACGDDIIRINDLNRAKNIGNDHFRAYGYLLQGKKEEFDALLQEIMTTAQQKNNYEAQQAVQTISLLKKDFEEISKEFPPIAKQPVVAVVEKPQVIVSPPKQSFTSINDRLKALEVRNPHLDTQEQFDRRFKEEDGLITRLRAAGHNPQEGAYRRKAYILFDALMAKEKNGAPINIDREQALTQIRACGEEIIRINDLKRAKGIDNDHVRAYGYLLQGKKEEFDTLLQEIMATAQQKNSYETQLATQNIIKLKKDFEEFSKEFPPIAKVVDAAEEQLTEKEGVEAINEHQPSSKAPSSPSEDTIDKRRLSSILNQYQTKSSFYFLFSCLGVSDKRSATITALFTLLNDPKTADKISRKQIEEAIQSESNEATRTHRSNLFKDSYKEQKNGTSTDDVLNELSKEFNQTGPQ